MDPIFYLSKKNFSQKSGLWTRCEILDNLLRINMMSVASSNSKNLPPPPVIVTVTRTVVLPG